MAEERKVLVVDDDRAHRTMLRTLLKGWGYDAEEADDGKTAVEFVERRPFDLVVMDIRMIKVSGIEALDRIKAINPAIPVILMTAYSSVETAVEALKKGAYDYLTKPLDFDKLKVTMERAMEHIHLKEENRMLKESLGKHFDRRNIIGNSSAMRFLLETVAQVAPSEATVLLQGESGTGKELIAGAIHFNSPRKNGPFIKINCAAIAETLLESELFGHEKGAFTGADRKKEGKFVQANRGSLFLDEIGEMSLTMQAKLLRVLQEREVTRVGGESVIPVDVRVIAATNQKLKNKIEEGEFREDLYYRLNVVELGMPNLRDRREDIPLLWAQRFLGDIFRKEPQRNQGVYTAGDEPYDTLRLAWKRSRAYERRGARRGADALHVHRPRGPSHLQRGPDRRKRLVRGICQFQHRGQAARGGGKTGCGRYPWTYAAETRAKRRGGWASRARHFTRS